MSTIYPTLTPKEIELLTGSTYKPSMPGATSWPTSLPLGHLATDGQRRKIVCDLVQEGYWVKATGSRVTKSGYTSESDWDYVVYDPDNHLVNKLLADSNWFKDGSGNGDPGIDFHSFKNGMTNLILVSTEDIWKKYIIATNLIKSLDCKTKEDRIKIFDSVFGREANVTALEF
jgi:hypothetical protein